MIKRLLLMIILMTQATSMAAAMMRAPRLKESDEPEKPRPHASFPSPPVILEEEKDKPAEGSHPHADKLFADIVADIQLGKEGIGILGPQVKLGLLIQAFKEGGGPQYLPHVAGQNASLRRLEGIFPTLTEAVRAAIVAHYHQECTIMLRTYPNGITFA